MMSTHLVTTFLFCMLCWSIQGEAAPPSSVETTGSGGEGVERGRPAGDPVSRLRVKMDSPPVLDLGTSCEWRTYTALERATLRRSAVWDVETGQRSNARWLADIALSAEIQPPLRLSHPTLATPDAPFGGPRPYSNDRSFGRTVWAATIEIRR